VTDLLIDPADLTRRMRTRDVAVIDARPTSAFAAAHLPGAVHLDLFGMSLVDTRPAPLKAFEWMVHHLFELRGLTRDKGVVVYEEDSGMRAARVVWLLQLFGHPDARLLDGGIRRWRDEGGPLTRDAVEPAPAELAVERHPERLATVEDVLAAIDRPDVSIVDVRARAEYTGELVRAARGGAVPGAVHVEWTRNLAGDGRYRPVGELRAKALFAPGIHLGTDVGQVVVDLLGDLFPLGRANQRRKERAWIAGG